MGKGREKCLWEKGLLEGPLSQKDFRLGMATASHRSVKWEISGSALRSAPKGAPGNRGAPRGAPDGAQGNQGCPRKCSRECSMISRSTLGSTS